MAVGRVGAAAALMLVVGWACASAPRAAAYCAELRGAGPGSDAIDPEATGSARLTIEGTAICSEAPLLPSGAVEPA